MRRYLFALLLMLMVVDHLSADTIYLKDGTHETSSKVWEQNGYVHFILKGTRNVEIRYAKEIVDRIEADPDQAASQSRQENRSKELPQVPAQPNQTASASLPSGDVGLKSPDSQKPQVTEKPVLGPVSLKPGQSFQSIDKPAQDDLGRIDLGPLEAAASGLAGVSFYDPKRPHKYWAGDNLQYDSIQQAIAALAGQYHRSTAWIEDNMGGTNDLGIIHQNLLAALQGQPAAPKLEPSTAKDSKKESSELASQNLPVNTEHDPPTASRIEDLSGPATGGPAFYDPRRPLKYWTSETDGHKTLKEALEALAQMYQRSPEWIEAHMGQTNDLNEIHHNLRQNSEK